MNIKEKLKSKINIFGKQISVFMIMFVLMTSVGTAALLTNYGSVTGIATVSQSVTVNDTDELCNGNACTYIIGDSPAQAGNTYLDGVFTVKNLAEVPATITLSTLCRNVTISEYYPQTNMSINWTDDTYSDVCDGIVTSYFGTVNLTTKNTATWKPTTGKRVTVVYSLVGDNFEYEIINEEGSAFELTDYRLIYYKDVEEDQCPPVTNNRAPGIVKFADDISESIPHVDDYNNKETANYCDNCYGDTYTHCTGAKLWLVHKDDVANGKMLRGNESKFLYETDLISYTKGTDNKITLPANGGGFDFVVKNELDVALKPDVYTIKTDVTPA